MTGKSGTERVWNSLSDEYQARHNIPTSYIHYGPLCPNEDELQLIGDISGKSVVELGCGGGQASIAFAKKGATVIGVDLSEKQLSYAKTLAEKNGVHIQFLKANIQDLSIIPESSQDIAFSSYAFQYVEDLWRGFREVYRTLKSGGVFVFSLDHPFWWCFPEHISELRVVRSYFNEKAMRGDFGLEYPRSLSRIFNALFDSGFIVARIIEPQPVERQGDQDKWPEYPLEGLRKVPATVIFKALKPHGFSDLLQKKVTH